MKITVMENENPVGAKQLRKMKIQVCPEHRVLNGKYQVKSSFLLKTYYDPMVIAVILGGAV